MRWSKMFIPTLRESPSKEVPRPVALLARAAFARIEAERIAAYLPLGERCLRKIEELVRQRLLDAGAQEFSLRVVHPAKAPATEGSIAAEASPESTPARETTVFSGSSDFIRPLRDIASDHLRSYRDLPQLWFFFGLRSSRGSELCSASCVAMAVGEEGARGVHDSLRNVFSKVIEECGVVFLAASAAFEPRCETVAEEHLAMSAEGDVEVALCRRGYTARVECAVSRGKDTFEDAPSPEQPQLVETPGKRTIADVSELLGVPPESIIKSLLYIVGGEPVLVLVSGSDQLNELLLRQAVNSSDVRPASDEEVKRTFGAEPGSIGPVTRERVRLLGDNALRHRRNMICGANRDDYHLMGVQPEEHFHAEYFDLRQVRDQDACPNCGNPLSIKRARLLMRSSAMENTGRRVAPIRVLGPDNQLQPVSLTAHILYLDALLLSLVEQFSDEDGIVLPRAIAPFDVVITPIKYSDTEQKGICDRLHSALTDGGLDVLLDDRDCSPGVKFKDADLIGVPLRITVGPKKLKGGKVELRWRRTAELLDCTVEKAARAAMKSLVAWKEVAWEGER